MAMGEWWLNRYVYTVLIRGETHENNSVTRKGNKAVTGPTPLSFKTKHLFISSFTLLLAPFITNYRIIKT